VVVRRPRTTRIIIIILFRHLPYDNTVLYSRVAGRPAVGLAAAVLPRCTHSIARPLDSFLLLLARMPTTPRERRTGEPDDDNEEQHLRAATSRLQTIAITGKACCPVYTTSRLIADRGGGGGGGGNLHHHSTTMKRCWSFGFQNVVPVSVIDDNAKNRLQQLELHVAGVQVRAMFQPSCRVVRSQNQHQHDEPRLEVLVVADAVAEIPADGVCLAVGLELFPVTEETCQSMGLGRVRDSISWQHLATQLVLLHQQRQASSQDNRHRRLMVEFIGVQLPTDIAAELLWKGIANLPSNHRDI